MEDNSGKVGKFRTISLLNIEGNSSKNDIKRGMQEDACVKTNLKGSKAEEK